MDHDLSTEGLRRRLLDEIYAGTRAGLGAILLTRTRPDRPGRIIRKACTGFPDRTAGGIRHAHII